MEVWAHTMGERGCWCLEGNGCLTVGHQPSVLQGGWKPANCLLGLLWAGSSLGRKTAASCGNSSGGVKVGLWPPVKPSRCWFLGARSSVSYQVFLFSVKMWGHDSRGNNGKSQKPSPMDPMYAQLPFPSSLRAVKLPQLPMYGLTNLSLFVTESF